MKAPNPAWRYNILLNKDSGMQSPPELYDEKDLDSLTYADMQREDKQSLPELYDEEDLDNLTYVDMQNEDMRSSPESSDEGKTVDLVCTDMEEQELNGISGNSLKAPHDETL